MGSVAGSLRAIERLHELDPAVIVAGHGEVGGPELLDADEAYLRWVQELAQSGRSIVDTAKDADLGDFGKLVGSERLIGKRAPRVRRGTRHR